MKKESMRKYSLLGLVLIAASAVTAAVLPDNKDKGTSGRLVATNDGVAGQLTCSKDQATGNLCTWTATQGTGGEAAEDGTGSRTSSEGKNTSSITTTNGINPNEKTRTSNPASGAANNHTSFH